MRIVSFIIMVFFLSDALAQSISNDTIHWHENYNLTLADFKMEPMDFTGLAGEAFCMNIANYRKASTFAKTEFEVVAVFDRSKSWISREIDSLHGLQFFQVMFNIYELNARKLKRELTMTKFGADPGPIFEQKYNNSMTELSNQYNEFKKDTKMGSDREKLAAWDVFIRQELKLLEGYR